MTFSALQNESTPETGALPKFNRSEPQAATLVGLVSRILLGDNILIVDPANRKIVDIITKQEAGQ